MDDKVEIFFIIYYNSRLFETCPNCQITVFLCAINKDDKEKHELYLIARNGELGTLYFSSSYVRIGKVITPTSLIFFMWMLGQWTLNESWHAGHVFLQPPDRRFVCLLQIVHLPYKAEIAMCICVLTSSRVSPSKLWVVVHDHFTHFESIMKLMPISRHTTLPMTRENYFLINRNVKALNLVNLSDHLRYSRFGAKGDYSLLFHSLNI